MHVYFFELSLQTTKMTRAKKNDGGENSPHSPPPHFFLNKMDLCLSLRTTVLPTACLSVCLSGTWFIFCKQFLPVYFFFLPLIIPPQKFPPLSSLGCQPILWLFYAASAMTASVQKRSTVGSQICPISRDTYLYCAVTAFAFWLVCVA